MTQAPNGGAQPAKPAPQKSKFHWSRVLLVLSLAMNLAVIGIVAGAALGQDRDGGRLHTLQSRDIGYGPFVAALSEGERRDLGRDLRAAPGPERISRAALRREFETMLAALRAEPFDGAAFEALLDDKRLTLIERQKVGQDAFVARINAMSEADRAAFADRLEKLVRRGPPGGKKPGPDGDRDGKYKK